MQDRQRNAAWRRLAIKTTSGFGIVALFSGYQMYEYSKLDPLGGDLGYLIIMTMIIPVVFWISLLLTLLSVVIYWINRDQFGLESMPNKLKSIDITPAYPDEHSQPKRDEKLK